MNGINRLGRSAAAGSVSGEAGSVSSKSEIHHEHLDGAPRGVTGRRIDVLTELNLGFTTA